MNQLLDKIKLSLTPDEVKSLEKLIREYEDLTKVTFRVEAIKDNGLDEDRDSYAYDTLRFVCMHTTIPKKYLIWDGESWETIDNLILRNVAEVLYGINKYVRYYNTQTASDEKALKQQNLLSSFR